MHFSEGVSRAYASDELEQHLRALAQTAASFSRDIDAETMLAYALRASASGCHAKRALMMIVDGRDLSLRGVAPAIGISDADAIAFRTVSDESKAIDAALQHGESTIVNGPDESVDFPPVAAALGAYNCLVAPVAAGKDIVGILVLLDKGSAYGGFNALDVAFVRTTVGLLASALHGMRLRDRDASSVVGNVLGLVAQPQFDETFALEMERAQRLGLALGCAALKVANYRDIVQTHGPQAADVVMRHLGQTLAKHVRQIDILLRYDDERIVLLMPGEKSDTARAVVRRLEAQVARISWPKVGKIALRCGVASYPADAKSANELVATAIKNAADSGVSSGAA
ncbi:MAG TPA: diguanylate cyclase [Candidatus Eremiobacteraceae bacterium]|nr:diguanylate cyclase [Candidatus Eremiobacteraceae bacterium]